MMVVWYELAANSGIHRETGGSTETRLNSPRGKYSMRLPYTLDQTINNNFPLVNRILAAAQD